MLKQLTLVILMIQTENQHLPSKKRSILEAT